MPSRPAQATGRARWLLEVVRFAVPAAALVLGLGVAVEQGGPFRPDGGMTTGQAMQELKVAVNMLSSREVAPAPSRVAVREGGGAAGVDSLDELGHLVGVPLEAAKRVFVLDRLVMVPPTLFLRHRETGALVVVSEGQRAALDRGRWRVSE